jgi:hypothetical protein
MRLFKQPGSDNKFQLHDLTEEELIAFFNVFINYIPYIDEILKQPDKNLLKIAPGSDASQVRHNIEIQKKACTDFAGMWNETINQGKKQN